MRLKGIEDSLNANQVLHTFPNDDQLIYHNRGIRIEFHGKRRVLSTSVLNGGIRDDMVGVFNYNCLGEQYECLLTEDTYEKELAANAVRIGMNSEKITGISTAAWIEYASIKESTFDDLTVTAIVTGGIDKNAVRVGDKASYYEKQGQFHMLDEGSKRVPGTINIILYINQKLSEGVLTRALVICTEAKVAAIQEMMIGSLYSNGFATGSGTDGTILISDISVQEQLTDAGEHSKLGEMIGTVVKGAVKEALSLQTGACGARQHKISERGKRYGITLGSIWESYERQKEILRSLSIGTYRSLSEFESRFAYYETNSSLVVWLSLYLYMLDQYQWGMLQWGEVIREAKTLTCSQLRIHNQNLIHWIFQIDLEQNLVEQLIECAKRSIIIALEPEVLQC